ncbi:hypothetical protein [Streptomyces sp. NPDC056401]|uniref:hypothetical protein n=1 Tax=Streptomyces sp. NPDC056401 TaxID=3345809 RepID=UPI0035D92D28
MAVLTVLCAVLLCLFGVGGAGPSTATAEGSRSAPAEPTEAPADPAGDPEVRVAVRVPARGVPGVRGLQRPVFHVKPPRSGPPETAAHPAVAAAPAASLRAVRSVVLRC